MLINTIVPIEIAITKTSEKYVNAPVVRIAKEPSSRVIVISTKTICILFKPNLINWWWKWSGPLILRSSLKLLGLCTIYLLIIT